MAQLFPPLNQRAHTLHRLLPLQQPRLKRALPLLTLHPLTLARALDAQPVLGAAPLRFVGQFRCPGEEREDVVCAGELDEFFLLAQGVGGPVPVAA